MRINMTCKEYHRPACSCESNSGLTPNAYRYKCMPYISIPADGTYQTKRR